MSGDQEKTTSHNKTKTQSEEREKHQNQHDYYDKDLMDKVENI